MAALRFALTYDAEHSDRTGWRSGVEDDVLDRLPDREVRATFLIQGRWAESALGGAGVGVTAS